jgi:serine O-acetyltransferase
MSLKRLLMADLSRLKVLGGHCEGRLSLVQTTFGFFSPRFAPVLLFRLSHFLYKHKVSPLAKLLSLANFVVFGIEIAVRSEIGKGVFFPHTQGTVLGAQRIGENATIFQNVTLGARELDMNYSTSARPTVGDNVIIGAGAKVLGGITVGNNVIIGANSVVTKSVPDDVIVAGIPAQIIRSREPNVPA